MNIGSHAPEALTAASLISSGPGQSGSPFDVGMNGTHFCEGWI